MTGNNIQSTVVRFSSADSCESSTCYSFSFYIQFCECVQISSDSSLISSGVDNSSYYDNGCFRMDYLVVVRSFYDALHYENGGMYNMNDERNSSNILNQIIISGTSLSLLRAHVQIQKHKSRFTGCTHIFQRGRSLSSFHLPARVFHSSESLFILYECILLISISGS